MAPELMKEEAYGLSADVYSFGIVMWVGYPQDPFEGVGGAKLIIGVTSQQLRPTIPDTVPSAWTALMKRCWSADPSSRLSFGEIVTELKAMKLGEGEISF